MGPNPPAGHPLPERLPFRSHGLSFAGAIGLPAPVTPLVGRERELALAATLLGRDDVRLLTITGPGGIGKTRLAIEIGRSQIASFADGVVFVSLAVVSDADQVAPTIVRALGLPEVASVAGGDTLVAALRDAAALVILDSFEHVLTAAPLLTDLLAACPLLKIATTSRSLLRLAGEYALPVPPLVLPTPDPAPSIEDITRSPAVRLFVDRVRALAPAFALSDETAPLVVGICRHLDGLPLAIELAAAQAVVLPPAALLARIEARLPLPVTGPRDAPARLRTIADAVAWSYDLLTVAEQHIFRQLSVFSGGFALDAAEAVTKGLHPAGSVLELVASLVDKSLLRQEAWEGEARFAMLETIRAFAGEQLAANGEADAVSDAHAAWTLALAEPAELAPFLPGQERQLRRLDVEHANLLAALLWLDRRGDTERLLRLTAALSGYWNAQGHFREGRDWLEHALARSPAARDSAQGRAQIGLGRLLMLFGEVERANRLLADGIEIVRADDAAPVIALALIRQAAIANHLGDHDRAERFLNESLELVPTIPDDAVAATVTGTVLANLGVAAQGRGDLDLARARLEQALRINRERGYTFGIIRCLRDLGDVDRDLGDFVRAVACYRECVSLLSEHNDLLVVVDALEGAALAAAAWHQPAQAARLLGAAEAYRERHGGMFMVPADLAAHQRAMAAIRDALDESAIDAAWQAGRQLALANAIAEIQALSPPDASTSSTGPTDPSTVNLSPRETDVLRLLVAGHPDRAIAEALFLSVRTVEAHVARILTKLDVRTRTAAVSAAISAGLVDPPLPSMPGQHRD